MINKRKWRLIYIKKNDIYNPLCFILTKNHIKGLQNRKKSNIVAIAVT
jgi:hypothetical protein